jgi:hypothetical protein
MKDLKIRVADEAESKEAQELFFGLGYYWAYKNLGKKLLLSKKDIYLYAESDGTLGAGTHQDEVFFNNWFGKEITIQELKDLVVLKRNDPKDATHNFFYIGSYKPTLIYVDCDNKTYFWGGQKWMHEKYNINALKPIQKEKISKEYLEKQADGSYKLVMRGIVGKDDDIEVPEGADAAFKKQYGDGLCFFQCVGENGADWCSETKKWISRINPVDDWYFKNSPWQRHTQPEDLPFMDSLNDQYAEIEQVRQSGMKFDSNKPRHSLLPKGAVNSVIKVLEFGAKKYDADNWQKVDNAEERYYNAAMRHIDSWWNGEKCDPETGSHHLAHAATNLFFLMWFDNK